MFLYRFDLRQSLPTDFMELLNALDFKTQFKFEEVHELRGNNLEDYLRFMFHVNRTGKNGDGHVFDGGYEADIAIILSCNTDIFDRFPFMIWLQGRKWEVDQCIHHFYWIAINQEYHKYHWRTYLSLILLQEANWCN